MRAKKQVGFLKMLITAMTMFIVLGILYCGTSKDETKGTANAQSTDTQVVEQEAVSEYKPEVISVGEWPQWLGPNRDGISQETGLLKSWPVDGPKVLWRIPLGEGFSGISVTKDGRVYTMFAEDDAAYAVCVEASTGKEVWRFQVGKKFPDSMGGNGPRCTPTVDENLVFVFSAYGRLFALNAQDGQQVWAKNFETELGAEVPQWGFSSSLLVEGNMLIVETGGKSGKLLAAYNKTNGDLIWASQSDKAGYSSPIAITVGGIRQIIFFTGTNIMSVSPADGKLFWQESWETKYDVNAATPIFIPPDKIFISSGYDHGSATFQMKTDDGTVSVQRIWDNPKMRNHFSSCVLHGNYFYGCDEKVVRWISADTGEEKWKQRGLGKGSLLFADDHLIILSDEGALVLAEATPVEYKEKARAEILSGRCWTVPSLAGGKLYLRNMDEMVCLEMTAQ